MISEVTKGVYNILEKMAEKEIERDPLDFIRKESLQVKLPDAAQQALKMGKKLTPHPQDGDSDDEFKDAFDGTELPTPKLQPN